MSREKPKAMAIDGAAKERVIQRLLPILTPLVPVGVAVMANPTIGYLVFVSAVTVIWFLITWVGPLSCKFIRYSGYGAIVAIALVLGLCLPYSGKKNDSENVAAPQPNVTNNIQNGQETTTINAPGGTVIHARDINNLTVGQSTPRVADPESTENKYVRIKKLLSSPDKRFTHAVLIEFGVLHVDSDGAAVLVGLVGGTYKHWFGEPMRTDVQEGSLILTGFIKSADGSPLVRCFDSPNITPRKSYYLCVMSNNEIAQPDILYFAVRANEKSVLSPKREQLGHQYQWRQ